jgi:hypothetical protein
VKFEVMAEGSESLAERKARAKQALEARMTLYKKECKSAGLEIMHTGARLRLPSGRFVLKENEKFFMEQRLSESTRKVILPKGFYGNWEPFKFVWKLNELIYSEVEELFTNFTAMNKYFLFSF